ncbi:uncharacterized protein LOC143354683 [Halictus rubicundus]|uniref:uncharacterized protein LOC143354683 n=1 Tax=Halictus rubicundus TaxID=77578 RepID=UPI004035F5C6
MKSKLDSSSTVNSTAKFVRVSQASELENARPSISSEKIAMFTTGNKGPSAGIKAPVQRTKAPRSATPRNAVNFQKDLTGNTTDDASSSTKSQTNSARRSPGKMAVSPTAFKRPSSTTPVTAALKLEKQYQLKKERFQRLKKDLMEKQKAAQDVYNEVSQLREKVIANGTKDPGKLDDLRIEVGSFRHLGPSDPGKTDTNDRTLDAIGSDYVERLGRQLQSIPQKSQNLCRDILNKQAELMAFVASRLKPDPNEPDGDNANFAVVAQLETQQKDFESLEACLEQAEAMGAGIIEQILTEARGIIVTYETNHAKLKELKQMEEQTELQSQLDRVSEELQAEKEKSNQARERLRQVDSQMQKAKTKLREMEAEGIANEEKIQTLQTNLKNLTAQMRQKEQLMETKMKDTQKTLKSSEALIAKVEKQRDSFETRLFELKEKMSAKDNETMNTIKELSEKLNAVTRDFGAEREKRQQVEEALNNMEERYKQLEEKSNQLCEMAEKTKDLTITEGNHSDNEVRLFNELQETKEELEIHKQLVLELQQEKDEIVAVMHQAADHDEDQNSREKLAAELVFKTTELKNLMMQYSDLKKIAKNAQEKSGSLEQQLIEIQGRLRSQTKEGGKVGLSAQAIELQQEVSDLRNNLAEVLQQKEELETALTQKQLELEQRDIVMREQGKVLKLRDELLVLLKGKTQDENGDSQTDENNEYTDQIALKTEAIQELYTTLKSKQMQVMRLEKMVKLMEDQQDRAQAQRTRLENRIAQLEMALQRNKEQRYVRDRLSLPMKSQEIGDQNRFSDSDQPASLHSLASHYSPHSNPYGSVIKRSEAALSTIASQTDDNQSYQDLEIVSRQSSSDEEQHYVCERCRELGPLSKDDEQWSNKESSNEDGQESFRNRFTDESSLGKRQYLVNNDFRENVYYDSPAIRGRSFISSRSSPHAESANVYDSSRESHDPYLMGGCQRLHALRYYVRLLPTHRHHSRNENL